jgi:hypothetical protein
MTNVDGIKSHRGKNVQMTAAYASGIYGTYTIVSEEGQFMMDEASPDGVRTIVRERYALTIRPLEQRRAAMKRVGEYGTHRALVQARWDARLLERKTLHAMHATRRVRL